MSSNDLFSNKPLNILKASLPYVPSTMQKVISYYIKIEEFNIMRNSFNTSPDDLLSACDNGSDNNHKNNPIELINAVKPYLNSEEKNLIDMFMNMVSAFNMYNTYKSLNLPALRPESFNFNNPDGTLYNSGNKPNTSDIDDGGFVNGPDYDNDNISHADNLENVSNKNIINASYNGNNMNNSSDSNISNTINNNFNKNMNNTPDNSNNKQGNSSPNNIPANIDIDALKNMLSPSQRAMFDTYSSLLNKNK